MSRLQVSEVGDLQPMCKEVAEVMARHLHGLGASPGTPGLAICFTLPPEYKTCHWITNLERDDAIRLFDDTALKLRTTIN